MKIIIAIVSLIPLFSIAKSPDCHSWPMNMAEVWMKNASIVDIVDLDQSKTEIKRLASEKKEKDKYTQIYRFVFHNRNGKTYQIITESDASESECSMSEVNCYLISDSDINH